VAKQLLFESTFLVIMDPTSSTIKNVTPYCPKLPQVLDYFKRIYMALCAIKQECEKRLEIGQEANRMIEELSEETIQNEIESVNASFAPPSTKIFNTLMNLIDITQCEQTLDE
jgi:hypothetical protein